MEEAPSKLEALVAQFLGAAHDRATGTLSVTGADGSSKQILFLRGSVTDVDTGRDDTLLEAALVTTGAFTERDLRTARKKAEKTQASLGTVLLESGAVPEEVVERRIRERLADEVSEVFAWEIETSGFLAHGEDERLEGFFSDLGSHYEILADAEELFIEAASRLKRWDLVERHFPMLKDVFYATPASFKYFRDQAQYPLEHELLQHVDGTKDVAEVIAQSALDPFTALVLFRRLGVAGELELINPVQMYQLGVENLTANRFEKARKLFQRAYERGLDDFDLQLKLAQALEGVGKKEEAVERYLEFADRCLSQMRTEDALKCLKRVTALAPDRLEARERYLEALLQEDEHTAAVDEALAVARILATRGEMQRGIEILARVREEVPREVRLQQKIIELAEICGDAETAAAERERLAKTCEERKDLQAALEAYQRMFCEGNESLEVRLKLVELHKLKGNREKALEHIYSILNLPDQERPRDDATLLSLHETVRHLKPSDLRSNRWLAEHYSRKGDNARAAQVLISWISHLEREGDLYEMANAYERLILLDDRHEHRWGFAQVLSKLGREAEALRELRTMAQLALREEDFANARKALEHVLKQAPLDIEAKKLFADMYEAEDRSDLAARAREEVAHLSIYSGNAHEAELHCRSLDPARPAVPGIIYDLGRLCLERGDHEKGLEQILKAARLHLGRKNLGLCRAAVEEILAIAPANKEALALRSELEAAERRPAPEPPAAPVAAPARDDAAQGLAEPPPPSPGGGLFEPPRPIRTTVANITAKLRRLKTAGGSPESPGAEAANAAASPAESPPQPPGAEGPAPAAGSDTSGSTAASEPSGATVRKARLAGAASRLAALRRKEPVVE